ncbi:hypothetical protein C1H46_045541 [Malus baccata]|uniref:Uncharacterized protein n=1 Tax=Malus baccata TaxID=106549 RepID=A0A540K3X0_MALBA|nr:hypothetical protein C1H46_045541 [Malus baccata]
MILLVNQDTHGFGLICGLYITITKPSESHNLTQSMKREKSRKLMETNNKQADSLASTSLSFHPSPGDCATILNRNLLRSEELLPQYPSTGRFPRHENPGLGAAGDVLNWVTEIFDSISQILRDSRSESKQELACGGACEKTLLDEWGRVGRRRERRKVRG